MLTKSEIKQYRSLCRKKYRDLYRQFLVQGTKLVLEVAVSEWQPEKIIASQAWINEHKHKIPLNIDIVLADKTQLEQISNLKTAPEVIALMPFREFNANLSFPDDLVLALDCIQDPGNLGAVIRIADWYGISTIICSEDTACFMNPKVIQSSMGGFLRVNLHYLNLHDCLTRWKNENPELAIYGSFMNGIDVYQTELSNQAVLIMGNEGQGISSALESVCTSRIAIPNYPKHRNAMESLNISVATGILCSEFRRRG